MTNTAEDLNYQVKNLLLTYPSDWYIHKDTFNAVKLEFKTKELAIEYSKKNKIDYELIESKNRKIIKKSYSDNFTK